MNFLKHSALLALIAVASSAAAQTRYPALNWVTKTLVGVWTDASLVVVGTVDKVEAYGVQRVDRLPWPASPGLHELYWCQGTLKVAATLKGDAPTKPALVLWADVKPGCELEGSGIQASSWSRTKVYFIRKEMPLPTLINATHFQMYLGLPQEWGEASKPPPRERLGNMLLDPVSNPDRFRRPGEPDWDRWDLACELMGKAGCVRRLNEIARSRDASARAAACLYLDAQQNVRCDP